MSTLGLKEAMGFSEMRVQTGKNICLLIHNPDVMKLANKGQTTYAVFGKVDVKDFNAHEAQAKQMMEQIKEMQRKAEDNGEESDDDCPDLAEVNFEQVESNEDAGDLDENDIELVVKQAGVTKAKAIKALKSNDNDVVNPIMALSG